ncbi:MAG TPA: hypothetical protein VH619_15570 [Verrucomicrobiae bacterium]|nr:hypothetical protein [Verrucomicrobiae bacterium]
MNDVASHQADGQAHAQAGRYATAIIRTLLGLMFLVFGLNGFLNFIPAPKEMPQPMMKVLGALMEAGYMNVVSGTEVIAALALALLAPVIVGILTFHVAIVRASIGLGNCRIGEGTVSWLGLSRGVPVDVAGEDDAWRELNWKTH